MGVEAPVEWLDEEDWSTDTFFLRSLYSRALIGITVYTVHTLSAHASNMFICIHLIHISYNTLTSSALSTGQLFQSVDTTEWYYVKQGVSE